MLVTVARQPLLDDQALAGAFAVLKAGGAQRRRRGRERSASPHPPSSPPIPFFATFPSHNCMSDRGSPRGSSLFATAASRKGSHHWALSLSDAPETIIRRPRLVPPGSIECRRIESRRA